MGGIPPDPTEETAEFEHMYSMFQRESTHVVAPPPKAPVPVDPLAAYRSNRTGRKWAPLPLVCFRLGLTCPYDDDEIRAINKKAKEKLQPEEKEDK
jgi:hypothetical protein